MTGLPSAWSQDVALADLEACAALPNDAEKVACMNAIIEAERGQGPSPAPAIEAAPAAAAAPAKSTVRSPSPPASARPAIAVAPAPADSTPSPAPAGEAPAASAVAPAIATQAEMHKVSGAGTDKTGAAMPAADESTASMENGTPPSSAPGSVADFGREQLEQDEASRPERLSATVVDVTRAYNDALIFHMDNGQVWRQIEPRRYPYPKNGAFAVTISQGMMGEYRMRIGNNGRMVRIRRIR